MRKTLILCWLISFIGNSFANSCSKLEGNWKGHWNLKRYQYKASLKIKVQNNVISGKYFLNTDNTGTLKAKCLQVSANEAYLIFRKDPPWYNPCRGTFLQERNKQMLHIYCFKPSEAGYFARS